MSQLKRSMAVGAVYDIVVGLTIVTALEPLSRVLPIPFPSEPFYARMQGILLIGLGVLYALPAVDLKRNLRVVAGAIFVRAVGGGYLLCYTATGTIAPFFYAFALADLSFAIWHSVLLRKEHGIGFARLLLRGDAD